MSLSKNFPKLTIAKKGNLCNNQYMYFFVPEIKNHFVRGEDSTHLFSMRVRIDEEITITDLNGSLQKVKITKVDKKNRAVEWKIIKEEKLENRNKNILIQAQTDKIYLEKLAEITPLANIKKIYIVETENSANQGIKKDRLEKIIIRSCEQSEKVYKPKIEIVDKKDFENLLRSYKPTVLDCYLPGYNSSPRHSRVGGNPPKNQKHEIEKQPLFEEKKQSLCAAIGPEGGWSNKERELFVKLDLDFASLGETIYPAWIAGYTYFTKMENSIKFNQKLKNLGWDFEI